MERVPRPLDADVATADDDAMNSAALLSTVLALVAFVAVVVIALKVAQSIFGTGSKRAAATEVAAKLVSYPTASDGVLRRRFVRALVTQHVVMPSGERLAFADLTLRVAPEDLERLDPDGDLDRLGEDAAGLYRTHAEREGWALPGSVSVTVEIDPALRAGWIPPARGTRRTERVGVLGVPRTDTPDEPPTWLGWDRVGSSKESDGRGADAPRLQPPEDDRPTATVAAIRHLGADAETMTFPAAVPDASTVDVVPRLRLERDGRTALIGQHDDAVLGRGAQSPLSMSQSEVSSRHAEVRWRAGQWQVRDVGSTNGTTLDGQRLDSEVWTTLVDGAVLALAGVRILVATEGTGTVRREALRAH